LNQNPSSNKEDTTQAHWHGDVDLEAIPRWHAFAYFCTLLGCSRDLLHIGVDVAESHDANMELEGNGILNIYEDASISTYL
jgi:hypothetical protein